MATAFAAGGQRRVLWRPRSRVKLVSPEGLVLKS